MNGDGFSRNRLAASIVLLAITATVALGFGALCYAEGPSDFSQVISRYGKPDIDHCTVKDKPRPKMVTRYIVYKKEKVRFWFIPKESRNYEDNNNWSFLGIVDEKTKKPISAQEMAKRMKGRTKT